MYMYVFNTYIIYNIAEDFKEMKLVCADSQKENCVKLRSHKKKVSL